jgi:hypothetical protein
VIEYFLSAFFVTQPLDVASAATPPARAAPAPRPGPAMPDLGALIDDFLAHAPGEHRRELRGRLAHVVASPLVLRDAAEVSAEDMHTLMAELRAAGLTTARAGAVVDALRLVLAHGVAQGSLTVSPLVGFAPPEPAHTATASPTTAMLALAEQAVAWTARVLVIAFVLAALGLVVALA